MSDQMVVVFQTGLEEYGFPVANVISIEKDQGSTVIPKMPQYLVGVARIRGELVPVLDTSRILYNRPTVHTDKTRMIVVFTSELSVGLLVDDAKEIITVPGDSIKHINLVAYRQAGYFAGVATLPERMITLLDPEKFFASLDGIQDIKQHIQEQNHLA